MNHLRKTLWSALGFGVLSATPLHAQTHATDTGSWLLGGTASFTSTGGDNYEDRVHNLTLAPVAGGLLFFLNEHYALTAEVDYIYEELQIAFGNHPSTNTAFVGLGFAGFLF